MNETPLRLAHISDLHLIDEKTRLKLRDWLSKRAIGWANSRLTRNHLFAAAPQICQQLAKELPTRGLNGVIFTGDATTLGMKREFELTHTLLAPLMAQMTGVAVPGNHDHYTRQSVRQQWFEQTFAPWQQGARVAEQLYPFAREWHGIWFICVNSSKPNLAPWDSRGKVGKSQLARLENLLSQIPSGPKVLVTHYPYLLGTGDPEKRLRKLRDANLLWKQLERDCLCWLHGHRHLRYHVTIPGSECVDICVGSTTQAQRWTYNEYEFMPNQLTIQPRTWNAVLGCFEDGPREQIPLRGQTIN